MADNQTIQIMSLLTLHVCFLTRKDSSCSDDPQTNKSSAVWCPKADPTGGLVLDWGVRYKVAVGVAHGLHYLHESCQRRIIHRDIKASNILLGPDFEPQVIHLIHGFT